MHPSHDVLALLALGEQVGTDAEREHVSGCPECSAELAELSRLTELGRGLEPAVLETPPEHVWHRIVTELGLSGSSSAQPVPSPLATQSPAPTPLVPAGPAPARTGEPVAGRSRRRRGLVVTAVAAAVALVVGIGAGIGIDRYRSSHAQTVVASATLAGLPGWDATGRAVVEINQQGERQLVVTMTGPPIRDALTEAWLAKPDLSGMVALGQMDEGSGRFTLPAGIDLTQYSVVDVSKEPLDGNVAHSDDSIVRGQLN